jgi:hypothetical protein
MADLTDIFGNPAPAEPAPEPTPLDGPSDGLLQLAVAAADASDAARAARDEYQLAYDKEMEAVNERLAALKEARDKTASDLGDLAENLKLGMSDEDVDLIELTDRAITLKTRAGSKKPITLKWLKSHLGDERAKEIWSAVPKGPPKISLEIPQPAPPE